jgi:hypothetical protein
LEINVEKCNEFAAGGYQTLRAALTPRQYFAADQEPHGIDDRGPERDM